MTREFVRASRLYDVRSGNRISHPAIQASDADFQQALETREDQADRPVIRTDGGHSSSGTYRIGKTEVIPRDELEKTGENEHGPSYRCPRCGFEWVAEYCDCPDCLWAGMCQEGFE